MRILRRSASFCFLIFMQMQFKRALESNSSQFLVVDATIQIAVSRNCFANLCPEIPPKELWTEIKSAAVSLEFIFRLILSRLSWNPREISFKLRCCGSSEAWIGDIRVFREGSLFAIDTWVARKKESYTIVTSFLTGMYCVSRLYNVSPIL